VTLDVQRLSKRFGNDVVLKDVSLMVAPGEICGLIGASASGKTLLSRCIVALEPFDSGRVVVGAASIAAHASRFDGTSQAMRRMVGVVFQTQRFPGYRTVAQLIAEGPSVVAGSSRSEVRDLVMYWAGRLGLIPHLHKFPLEISGGTLARVALARAAAVHPQFLICDEVTANLDPAVAGEVAEVIEGLASDGVGCLLISHQFEFLRRRASRLLVLANGVIVESGPPAQVLDAPQSPDGIKFINAAKRGR